jgi:hypothetical protein
MSLVRHIDSQRGNKFTHKLAAGEEEKAEREGTGNEDVREKKNSF